MQKRGQTRRSNFTTYFCLGGWSPSICRWYSHHSERLPERIFMSQRYYLVICLLCWFENFHKSCMMQILVNEEKLEILAGTFGCNIGSMPFTYLGLLVGTTKPRIVEFAPLIDWVERRFPAITMFLNHGQRLTLINYMSSLRYQPSICAHSNSQRKW